MKRYRVTIRVYNRRELLAGVELPDGLAIRAAQFTHQDGEDYIELVCVEDVHYTKVGEFAP